ncbi:MAG TPA: hypothetical protein VNU97_18875 [Rhizomicrobium sp.]|jgi:hypothetical protein|nr:hypothetical protein [Rhizomicrobium sp.]
MRRLAALAFGLGCFAATPCLADCDSGGHKAIEGGRVCQAGVVSVCSAGAWLQTVLTCAASPDGADKPLMTQAPGSATRIHVLNARFLAPRGALDLTFAARSLCDGKPACTLGAAQLLGAASPRGQGTFNIGYACTTGFETRNAQQAVFAASQSQTLSCGE